MSTPMSRIAPVSSSSTLFGQTERRDVGAHQAAGLVVLFEDRDLVAQRHQVVGDGERRRTRADAGDALAVLCARELAAARSLISPFDRRRRASGGRWRQACRIQTCRGGKRVRRDGRKCGRESREIRSIPGSTCRRRCSGPCAISRMYSGTLVCAGHAHWQSTTLWK